VYSGIATYESRKVMVEPGIGRCGPRTVKGFVDVGFIKS
jgi:hypothetical protein